MQEKETFGSFFIENKKLAKEYLDIKAEIYRLKFTGLFSRFAGYFIWIIISLFLLWLLIIFSGIVIGFWLSDLTGSYIKGFGFATLGTVLVIILLALLRKPLFVNPIIRTIIKKSNVESPEEHK